ncbi:TPA: endolytic transglycosylase MltG [Streptococcus suis]
MDKFDWKALKEKAKEKEALTVKEEFWTAKIVKIILLVCILLVLISGAGAYLWYSRSLEAVNPSATEVVEVEIPIGSSSLDVAHLLKDKDIIKNVDIFRFYMRSKNISDLQAGTYQFSQAMDADAVIAKLEEGGIPVQVDVDAKITIIEGSQLNEIGAVIEANTPYSAEEFVTLVNDQAFIDKMINQFPSLLGGLNEIEGLRYPLEGYLFPATYDYLAGTPLENLVREMIETANLRYQSIKELVDNHWLSYHEILSLASIVEREGVTTEDRQTIAGVFFNRIEAGMPLQSDITVLYALDEHKEFVTYDDIEVDSPYNLYLNPGLPPGPVNTPSMDAIQAVLDPIWTNYYYFVADLDTGDIYYSSTLEEHEALVEIYVNARQEAIDASNSEASSGNEAGLESTSQEVDEVSE